MLSIRKIRENIILYYESCSVASNVEREQRVRASFRVAKVCPRSTKDNKRYMMHNELLKKGKDKGKQRIRIIMELAYCVLSMFLGIFHRRRHKKHENTTYYGFSAIDNDQLFSRVAFVAIDCEMVGVGKGGLESMLARCSIVSFTDSNRLQIKILYDKFVKPTKAVTDFRTQYSGITAELLKQKDGSVVSFEECRNAVLQLLSSTSDGRIVVVVGHGLENDFDVLKIKVGCPHDVPLFFRDITYLLVSFSIHEF